MKRIQLFEFEDYAWFPVWLRTCMTNLIMVLHRMMGVNEVLAYLIFRVLKEKNLSKIVDLGSGSSGAMPDTMEALRELDSLRHLELLMTDLYPNKEIARRFNENTADNISYLETPFVCIDGCAIKFISPFQDPVLGRTYSSTKQDKKKYLQCFSQVHNVISFICIFYRQEMLFEHHERSLFQSPLCYVNKRRVQHIPHFPY